MYTIKVIKRIKGTRKGKVIVALPCDNYQVHIIPQDEKTPDGTQLNHGIHIDATRYEDVPGVMVDNKTNPEKPTWVQQRRPVTVEIRLPHDGDSVYVENEEGKTTDSYHWPLRQSKEEVERATKSAPVMKSLSDMLKAQG